MKLPAGQEYPLAEGDTIGLGQPTVKLWDKKAHVYKLCLRQVDQTNKKVKSELIKCPHLKKENNDLEMLDFYSSLKCTVPCGCLRELPSASDSCDGHTTLVRQPLREALNVESNSSNNCVDIENKDNCGCHHSCETMEGTGIRPLSDLLNSSAGDVRKTITADNDTTVLQHDSKLELKLQPFNGKQTIAAVQLTSNMVVDSWDRKCNQKFPPKEQLPERNLRLCATPAVKSEDNVRCHKHNMTECVPCSINFTSTREEENKILCVPKLDRNCAGVINHFPRAVEVCKKEETWNGNYCFQDDHANNLSPVLQPMQYLLTKQLDTDQAECSNVVGNSVTIPKGITSIKTEKITLIDEPIVISDSDDSSSGTKSFHIINKHSYNLADKKMLSCSQTLKVSLKKCTKCNSCHSRDVGCIIADSGVLKVTTGQETIRSSDSDDDSFVIRQPYKTRKSLRLKQGHQKRNRIISSGSDTDEDANKSRDVSVSKRSISDSDNSSSGIVQNKRIKELSPKQAQGLEGNKLGQRSLFQTGNEKRLTLQTVDIPVSDTVTHVAFSSPSVPKCMVASLSSLIQKNAETGGLFSNLGKRSDKNHNVGESSSNPQRASPINVDDTVIKQEPPPNVVEEKESVLSDSDGEYGYTQDDEVILISDDEVNYFACSQSTPVVKEEPEWCEEHSWGSWTNSGFDKAEVHEQVHKLDVNNVNAAINSDKLRTCEPVKVKGFDILTSATTNESSVHEGKTLTVADNKCVPELCDFSDDKKEHKDTCLPELSENICHEGINDKPAGDQFFPELLQNFEDDGLKDQNEDDQFFPELSQSFDNDDSNDQNEDDQFFPELSQSFDDDGSKDQNDGQFFPDLSQNFFNDAGSDHEFEDDTDVPQPSTLVNKNSTCKFYRTKFTEPMPMIPKNKRLGVYQNNLKPKENVCTSPLPTCSTLTSHTYHTKKRKKKDSVAQLKKKVQKNLGNRIPIPGGGSAIPCPPINLKTQEPPKKPIPKSKPSVKVLSPSLSNQSVSTIANQSVKLTVQADKLNKPKAPAKTSNRAEMRSTFLADICLQDKQDIHKSRSNHLKTSWKIPKATMASNESVLTEPGPSARVEKSITSHFGDVNIDIGKVISENMMKDALQPQNLLKPTATVKKVRFNDKEETRYFTGGHTNVGKSQVASVAPFHIEDSNTPGPNLKPSYVHTVDEIIRIIVSWVPAWLPQQENNDKPPPVINYKKLWPTLLAYKSYDDYVQVYKPLLLLETWAVITKDWKLHQPPSTMLVAITNVVTSLPNHNIACTDFTCQTLCTPEEISTGLYPQEGQILILDVVVQPAPLTAGSNLASFKQVLPVFGFVERSTRSPYKLTTNPSLVLIRHPAARVENAAVVTLCVKTKQRSIPINTSGFMKVQIVSYLRPIMRQFQALFHLPRTILARDILQPRVRNCTMMATPHTQLQVKGVFNQQQRDVILAIADACSQGSVPRICLLQGPPGTGKSHTTVGVVQQLLFGNDMKSKSGIHPKILLTAPSNSAIDELVIRLIKVKKTIAQTRRFRIVRVGAPHHVHPEVREYMLENLVRQNLETRLKERNTTESVEQELRSLEAQSNALHTKQESAYLRNLTDQIPKIKKELAEIQRRIERLQKQKNFCLPTLCDRRKEEQRLMVEMLQGADVVATTLGSCRQAHMEAAFQDPKTTFSACIVDEATQCIEQLMLLPLMFGITKLILVGDPQQLPATVLSQKAMEFGLHQSLFERLYLYFKQRQQPSPVWMLTTQYRMHPNICQFPSKCFYESKLESHGLIEAKYRRNQFVPYTLFDLQYVQEQGDVVNGLMSNPLEAEFVITLISVILKNNQEQLAVGIITPYQQQKQLLKNMLKERFSVKAHSIEVNTVDGFQGREKDLIILSTVRAKNISRSIGFLTHEKRMCVALTRAKQSFYICGHLSSLQVNSSWRALIHDARERGHIIEVQNPLSEGRLSYYILKSN